MSYDVETIAALESGAIVVRDLLTVQGKTLGGSAATFAYWTGEDNVAINVVPAGAETPVSRNFGEVAALTPIRTATSPKLRP